MKLGQLHRLRHGIQVNASPAPRAELDAVVERLRDHLLLSALFVSVEVEATDDPDRLVAVLCEIRPAYAERDVAARLEALWVHRIASPFWEASACVVERGHVELQAVTRASATGHYVTLHLVAQKKVIPGQRLPVVEPSRTAALR